MTQTTARFETEHASRYLQQLCKHFGHKVPTEFTTQTGHIAFPFGQCELSATDTGLTLRASGATSKLNKLERILGDHLARFAFREAPTLVWQRAV